MTEQPKPATDAERRKWVEACAPFGANNPVAFRLRSLNARIDDEKARADAAEIDDDDLEVEKDLRKRIAELEAERDSWRSKHHTKLEALKRRSKEKAKLEAKLKAAEIALGEISEVVWGGGWTKPQDVVDRVKQKRSQAKQSLLWCEGDNIVIEYL